jgi:signal transduction histidine kinase
VRAPEPPPAAVAAAPGAPVPAAAAAAASAAASPSAVEPPAAAPLPRPRPKATPGNPPVPLGRDLIVLAALGLLAALAPRWVSPIVVLSAVGLLSAAVFIAWGWLSWKVASERSGSERVAWLWFVASVPVTLVGYTALYASGISSTTSYTPTGNPAEVGVTLAVYGLIFVGLLVLGFGGTGRGLAARRAVDAAIVAGSLFFILWTLVYADRFEVSGLTLPSRIAVVATPFIDSCLLTLAALALAGVDPARPRGYRYVLVALLVVFLTDALGTALLLGGYPGAFDVMNAGYLASMVLLMLSAVYVRRAAPWAPASDRRASLWLQALPMLALAPALVVAMGAYIQLGRLSAVQFWTSAVVISAVCVQIGFTLSDNERLRRRLDAESEFKTRLLRFISHEISNPLSPLRVQNAILRSGRSPNAQRGWDVVDRSVQRLLALSDDVREMALAETHQLLTRVERADAGELLKASAASWEGPAKEKWQTLQVEAPAEALPVRVDVQRFAQVLDNLASNAVKYTPTGGAITMRVRRAGDRARVEVQDTGLGLDAGQTAHLFQPFGRVQDPSAAAGLGLGLYLCRAIVLELKGEIGVTSPGRKQGSTFWVEVPLDLPGADGLPPLGDFRRAAPSASASHEFDAKVLAATQS